MKSKFKKLAILSIAAFSLFASRQAFAMNPNDNDKKLDQHTMVVISKYFEKVKDYINLAKTCKDYDITAIPAQNYIPLSGKELKIFTGIQTYYVESYHTAIAISITKSDMPNTVTKIVFKKFLPAAVNYMIQDVKRLNDKIEKLKNDDGHEKVKIKLPYIISINDNGDFDIVFEYKIRDEKGRYNGYASIDGKGISRTMVFEVRKDNPYYDAIIEILKEANII